MHSPSEKQKLFGKLFSVLGRSLLYWTRSAVSILISVELRFFLMLITVIYSCVSLSCLQVFYISFSIVYLDSIITIFWVGLSCLLNLSELIRWFVSFFKITVLSFLSSFLDYFNRILDICFYGIVILLHICIRLSF